MIGDENVFSHLRKRHGIEAGGKDRIGPRNRVDLSVLSLQLSSSNVRVLFIRQLNSKLAEVIAKLKALNVFGNNVESTLFVPKVNFRDERSLHMITYKVPN